MKILEIRTGSSPQKIVHRKWYPFLKECEETLDFGQSCRTSLEGYKAYQRLFCAVWGYRLRRGLFVDLQVCYRRNGEVWIEKNIDKRERHIGEKNAGAKLKEGQVREIRNLWKQGKLKQYEIAEKFSVGKVTISDIVNKKAWLNVA